MRDSILGLPAGRLRCEKSDLKATPTPGFALDANRPAKGNCNSLNHGQAQSDTSDTTTTGVGRTIERLEHARHIFRLNTRPGINDGEDHRSIRPDRLDEYRRSGLPMLAGVFQQVVK